MALKIRYSLRARQEELELLEYILKEFGQSKAKEVFERIEKVIKQISEMPETYRSSKRKKGLRKCVFSKQTSIYYRVKEGFIEVVSFRPNKQDPGKFKI